MAGVNDMLNEARKSLGLGEPNHIQTWYKNRNGSSFAGNFAWCNAAITYWAYQSGNYQAVCFGTDYAYTVYHAQRFQKAGQWYSGTTANVKKAQPGDIVFFDWGGTDSVGAIDHVGVVEKNNGNGTVTTIEGNISNKCMRKTRDASTIAGYGRPKYTGTSSSPADPTPGYWAYHWTNGAQLHVPDGSTLLRRGSGGMDVKRLQNSLNLVFGEKLAVDGDFGPATEAAVKRAQSKLKVTADGEYGPQTANALKKHIEAALKPKDPAPPKEEPTPEPPKEEPQVPAEWGSWHYSEAHIARPLTIPFGIIKKGDKGDHVKKLQMALNAVGAGWNAHASGEFGDCTENALLAFQKVAKGDDLTTSLLDLEKGVYGHQTARALNRRILEHTDPLPEHQPPEEPEEPGSEPEVPEEEEEGTDTPSDPEPGEQPEVPEDPEPEPGVWGDRQLVFHDEFNGDQLDSSRWINGRSWSYPGGGPVNPNDNKLDHLDPETVKVENGELVITAVRDGSVWRTGLITTGNAFPEEDRFALQTGDFHAALVQMPENPIGAWPALWTWNNGGNEIDSFEWHGDNPNLLEITNHVNGGGKYIDLPELVKPGGWVWIATDFGATNNRYYVGATLDSLQLVFEDGTGVGSNWRAFAIINLSISAGQWHPSPQDDSPIVFRVSDYRVYR